MQQDQQQISISNRLMEACGGLENSLLTFKDINQKAHFIALCAAIEGARMRSRLGTFSIVANQIAAQASKNNQLSEKLEELIIKIKTESLEAIAVRNLELATDLIDKLDRNLFERNCDVQAWAGFEEVKNALVSPSEESANTARGILHRLNKIYVVYSESILLDATGKIVTASSRKDLIGSDLSSEVWFKDAAQGKVHVTDLHMSEIIDGRSVFYCSPVLDDSSNVIGVLCNCFDWNYALEMIQSGGFSEATRAIIANSMGIVIASSFDSQILSDTVTWMESGEKAVQKSCGFSTERSRNGSSVAVGFSHTKGYNAYRGKNWSSIIVENIGEVQLKLSSTITEIRTEPPFNPTNKSKQIASELSGEKLIQTMKQIDDLVLEINSNNREVKLLAVNASIQAGLAGSEGEGFSIIANEVAVLAKKSLSFVDSVNTITGQLREAVEYSSSVRLVDAAKDTMSKIDRNLFERFCDIQAWAIFGKLIEVSEQNILNDSSANSLLEQIHKIYEVYHDIYVTGLDGRVLASAINKSVIGQSFSTKDWFKSAIGGSIFVSDIYLSDTLKIPLMTFSSPIYSTTGQIVGIIASRFNCNFLNDIIRATIVDSHSKCFLIGHHGKVIGSSVNEDILSKNIVDLDQLKKGQTEDFGFVQHLVDTNAQDHCYGFMNSRGYNTYRGQKWTTVIERPIRKGHGQQDMSPAEKFKQLFSERLKRAA